MAQSQARTVANRIWLPHPLGFLKMNVDAAFDQVNLLAESGVVLRDHLGKVKACALTATKAEDCYGRGDSLQAIGEVQKDESSLMDCGVVVEDIKELVKQLDNFPFHHALREATLAHNIAKLHCFLNQELNQYMVRFGCCQY
ncbi:hypothetical protein REPUB_Repub15cG0069500 [Reevesia pubescens]